MTRTHHFSHNVSRTAFFIILALTFVWSGCGVEIYDLQPVLPTEITLTPNLTATPVERRAADLLASLATNTPPIHLAPTPIAQKTAVEILDVTMINGGTGWGIAQLPGGRDKLIVRTVDGAETWTNVTPAEIVYQGALHNLEPSAYFIDNNQAFILYWETDKWSPELGVKIYRTRDGGTEWTAIDLPVSGYTIQQFVNARIRFLTPQFGWVFATLGRSSDLEFSGLFTTVNGGDSWNVMISPDSTNLTPKGAKNGAVFRNATEGWISGKNHIESPGVVLYQTKDGGNSWTPQTIPAPQADGVPIDLLTNPAYTCDLSVPTFVDIQYQYAWARLICTGGQLREPLAFVYWTYDSGATWRSYKLPTADGNLTFYGIYQGWLSVKNTDADQTFPFKILATQNGGESWGTIANTAWDSKLSFIAPAIGFGIVEFQGKPAFVKSTDGGYNWNQVFPMINPTR